MPQGNTMDVVKTVQFRRKQWSKLYPLGYTKRHLVLHGGEIDALIKEIERLTELDKARVSQLAQAKRDHVQACFRADAAEASVKKMQEALRSIMNLASASVAAETVCSNCGHDVNDKMTECTSYGHCISVAQEARQNAACVSEGLTEKE